jgi:hypothetical protein
VHGVVAKYGVLVKEGIRDMSNGATIAYCILEMHEHFGLYKYQEH